MRPAMRCAICALLFHIFFVSPYARAAAPSTPVRAIIGNPVAELTGPWRFQPGDNMAWSEAD